MEVVVMVGFDAETDTAIRSVWQSLADAGLGRAIEPRHRPHMTMAVVEADDADEVERCLEAAGSAVDPVAISWAGLGVFPQAGVVILAPVVTTELLSAHVAIFDALAIASVRHRQSELLAPGQWVPHSSLHVGLAQDEIAIALSASGEGLGNRASFITHLAAAVRPEKSERWEVALARI